MMHLVLAQYCYHKSSIHPSVTLMYGRHIGWTSSKLITRIISLGLHFSEPQHRQSSPRGTSLKFGWNRGCGRSQQKTCNISETGQDRLRLLLVTNRKLHTRFRLVPKSTTLDDLEGHYAPCFKTRASFGAHHENLNEDRLHNQ